MKERNRRITLTPFVVGHWRAQWTCRTRREYRPLSRRSAGLSQNRGRQWGKQHCTRRNRFLRVEKAISGEPVIVCQLCVQTRVFVDLLKNAACLEQLVPLGLGLVGLNEAPHSARRDVGDTAPFDRLERRASKLIA